MREMAADPGFRRDDERSTQQTIFLQAISCIMIPIRCLFSQEKRIMLMSSIAADCSVSDRQVPPNIAARYGGRGWTGELKARFLDHLASKGNVRAACARVGLSPEAAYRLRRRDGLFGRAWAAALVLARESSVQVLAERAIDGIEETVWHRGEAVGTRRRYDARLLLAHIGRLDRLVDEEVAGADAGRFDELLARVAGEEIPDALRSDDGVLPLEREACIEQAERHARYAVRWQNEEETAADDDDDPYGEDDDEYLGDDPYGEDDDYLDEHEREARRIEREVRREAEERALLREERLIAEARRARAEAEAAWDAWTGRACEVADKASGWNAPPPAPGLPGSGVPLAVVEAVKHAAQEAAKLPEFSRPCTVSTVSTSALARALSGPARWQDQHNYAPRRRAEPRKRAGRRR